MDVTADSLVSRAAHEIGLRVESLIADVEECLRRELPELWEDADIARMTTDNITEHVLVAMAGLEHGIEPTRIDPPAADIARVRRLARHGTPVSAMLRGHRLAQGIALDRLLAELPRLTSDPELIGAAARKVIAVTTGYVDRTSEQGVVAYQEERHRRLRGRFSMVNEAGMRIGTTLDIARTTEELADLATERFADVVTVDMLDAALHGNDTQADEPPVLRRVARRSVTGDPDPTIAPQQLHIFPDGSPPDLALATGQSSRHHPDGPADAPGTHPVHSILVVPLRARGTTLGVAQFSRHRNVDRYDDEDLLLAQEIAAKAAVAVDNACRYTHARTTALSLQRSLLPTRTPPQSAVEVACRYLPAGGRVGVGGDWYDVIPLSGARVALVVGDVVGHGIHAAATMGRLRTAVRTLADIDLPPDELLTHLDDVVIRLSAEAATDPDAETASAELGATCLYAVYDPVGGSCTLARAGHVLPAVTTGAGAVGTLDLPPGPPLGLGGLPFEAVEVDLPEGSLLALYTDGLIEARDHDVETGLTLLHQVLARSAPSLESTADAVLEALLPARPDDDVALLLARTHALGDRQVATWDLEPEPAAVAGARSNVARQLSTWGLDDLDFTTELVVSELVTNAIRYGRPPIRLRLILPRLPGGPGDAPNGSLLCEVSDASGTTPHQRRARTYDEGGRGLLLVAQLAEHWGTRHARHGKTVWAELNEGAGVDAFTSVWA
ncbi:SpoIIE family protein phosphatase [Streptomyces sp. NPDC051738]|uniref:ATP-binding SpoIIE family protein phosphatase n=1 Tax=Streptomyces sp. NPDC051738 TaxID=3365672 RepID=UPI0037D5DF32